MTAHALIPAPLRRFLPTRPAAPGPLPVRAVAALAVLPKARVAPSPVAKMLRERGIMVFRGTVKGFDDATGAGTTAITLSAPVLTQAAATTGGTPLTITLDQDAARYLPPRTRVEVAIRIIPEDEEDDDGE